MNKEEAKVIGRKCGESTDRWMAWELSQWMVRLVRFTLNGPWRQWKHLRSDIISLPFFKFHQVTVSLIYCRWGRAS